LEAAWHSLDHQRQPQGDSSIGDIGAAGSRGERLGDVAPRLPLSACPAGKCRISARASASVAMVMTSGMTSDRGSARDQFGRVCAALTFSPPCDVQSALSGTAPRSHRFEPIQISL
jgi:hypothetical protein